MTLDRRYAAFEPVRRAGMSEAMPEVCDERNAPLVHECRLLASLSQIPALELAIVPAYSSQVSWN